MKYTHCCPKCDHSHIAKLEGGTFKGNYYNTITMGMSTIYLTRYVCVQCGYTENYIDDTKELEDIKNKFLPDSESSEFV
jgi:predicted nucleic-acid-binding Zn-ribbon protein